MLNAGNIVDELRALCQQHPASHHPLFDFLASEASAAQIDYFFKSDSALNLLFFDLVAMGLVGSLPETRAEIAQNLWDEIGQGSTEITHVNLYKDLLKRRNIALPDNHFAHLYEWQGLAGYNAFMLGGVNRQHYYKSLGVMAMTSCSTRRSMKNWWRAVGGLGFPSATCITMPNISRSTSVMRTAG